MRIRTGFMGGDRVLAALDKYCICGMLVVMVTLAQPVAAEVFADCSVSGNTTLDFDGAFGSGAASCAGSLSSTTNTVSGSAESAAAIGHLQASASITAGGPGKADAFARAQWFDTITLFSPGVPNGANVAVTFDFAVIGFLDATGIATAAYSLSFGSCSSAICTPGSVLLGHTVTATSGDPAIGTVGSRTIAVPTGSTEGISMGLITSARKPETLPFEMSIGAATVEFLGSAYWGGIREVRYGGVPVPYTLVSGSGLDLKRSFAPVAVPLPAAGWLFASVLLVVRFAARRHR